jgi:hypothetical protein
MTNELKLWIFWDLPVRAKRGEMKGPRGCLRVSSQSTHFDLASCRAELAAYVAASDGYGQFAHADVYDLAAWKADCLTAKPIIQIAA